MSSRRRPRLPILSNALIKVSGNLSQFHATLSRGNSERKPRSCPHSVEKGVDVMKRQSVIALTVCEPATARGWEGTSPA